MIKGLDNGYLYTKDNELKMFQSAFSTEDKVVSGAIPITIDNKTYYTGIGKGTVELDKTNLDITKICTLTNLAMSEAREFYLVVGLPVGQYKEQKDKFKEIILGYNQHMIEYQGKVKQFRINDVLVFPQGVASLYSIDNLSTNALIFDIGGRTFDIALIEMIDGKPTLIKSDTWYKGMLVLYSNIIEAVNKHFQLTLEIRYAEQILLHGLSLYGVKQDLAFLQPVIQEYLDDIFVQIKLNYPYMTTPTYLTGGGADLLANIFRKQFPNLTVIPNSQFSNAIGDYNVGVKAFGKYDINAKLINNKEINTWKLPINK